VALLRGVLADLTVLAARCVGVTINSFMNRSFEEEKKHVCAVLITLGTRGQRAIAVAALVARAVFCASAVTLLIALHNAVSANARV